MILYEPRMGKTVVAVNAVINDPTSHNILIICPLNAFYVWHDHFKEWGTYRKVPSINIILVRGTATQRQQLLNTPRTSTLNIFIMVQGSFIRDVPNMLDPKSKSFWLATFDTIIVDEFHKWLNSRGKTFQYLAPICRNAHRIHLLSGTPVDKGPHQLWPVLHLLNPIYFSSYWKFAETFCVFEENGWGGKEYVGPQNIEELHRVLARYARIRDRRETSMPKLTRSIMYVEMTNKQRKLHDQIDIADFAVQSDGTMLVTPNVMEKWLRLRQILACPGIFDPSIGPGSALENLADQLDDMPEEHRHVVIFCSFRAALPIFARYLEDRNFQVQQIFGGLEPQQLQERISRFRGDRRIMLCTSQYAQAFSLEPALACYHIGWDWSPNINKQAEDRLLSQSGLPVNSFYYVHRDSYVDERVAEVVIRKHAMVSAILGRPENM